MVDLDDYAASVISDSIYDMKTLTIDDLRERAMVCCSEFAESACCYTSDCMQIVNDYERHVDVSDYDCDVRFKASEWQEAMERYAVAVADEYLRTAVNCRLRTLEEFADVIAEAADAHGCTDVCEPVIGTDCPHGWAVHDSEDASGVHYWSEPNLEGCRAVAIKVEGVWLSYTWTPEEE